MKRMKTPWCSACGHEFYQSGCETCRGHRPDLAAKDDELLPAIDRVRDALDALLLRPELLPASSAIGNELEAALQHVLNARQIAEAPHAPRKTR